MGFARNFNYNDDSNPNVHIFHNDVDGKPNVSPGNIPAVLHKLQHDIQRTLDQIRDPHQPLPARTPTSVLEQPRNPIKIITGDMTSIARSCCVEMAAGSVLPSSPERRVVQLYAGLCFAATDAACSSLKSRKVSTKTPS